VLLYSFTVCLPQRRDDFSVDDSRAVPTKEVIEREEEKLEEVQQVQKDLFLIIFQASTNT